MIAWGNGQFSISKAGLDSLRWTVLGAGQCVTVSVGFTPLVEGLATTTARLTATTRSIRDSSIWRAIVSPGAGVDADEHAGYALTGLTPNPTGGAVAVGYTLGRPGRAVVAVYDPSGALVATLADEMQGAGEHRAAWDASGAAAGIYYCRITSGGWSAVRPIVVVR